jgi:hypothetical protein
LRFLEKDNLGGWFLEKDKPMPSRSNLQQRIEAEIGQVDTDQLLENTEQNNTGRRAPAAARTDLTNAFLTPLRGEFLAFAELVRILLRFATTVNVERDEITISRIHTYVDDTVHEPLYHMDDAIVRNQRFVFIIEISTGYRQAFPLRPFARRTSGEALLAFLRRLQ